MGGGSEEMGRGKKTGRERRRGGEEDEAVGDTVLRSPALNLKNFLLFSSAATGGHRILSCDPARENIR